MRTSIMKIMSEKFQSNDIKVVWMDGEPHWMFETASLLAGHKTVATTMTIVGRHAEFKDPVYMRTLKGAQYHDLRAMGEKFALNFELSAKARQISLFTEAGLWLLIDKSDSEIGREYRRKFSTEVAPQIARDGRYDPDRQVVGGQIMGQGTPAHDTRVQADRDTDIRLARAEASRARAYAESAKVLLKIEARLSEIGYTVTNGRSQLLVAAAEMAMGRPMPEIHPPADPRLQWETPSDIAKRHGINRSQVGRFRKEIGIADDDDRLYFYETHVPGNASRVERCYRIPPELVLLIDERITARQDALRAAKEAKEARRRERDERRAVTGTLQPALPGTKEVH